MKILELKRTIFEMIISLASQYELSSMKNNENKDLKAMNRASVHYGTVSGSLIYMCSEFQKERAEKRDQENM